LFVSVAQVRTRFEAPRASGTHSLQPVSKAGDEPSVSKGKDRLLVSDQEFTTIELDVVSDAHTIVLLQLRSGPRRLGDNLDPRFCHNPPIWPNVRARRRQPR